MSQNRNHEKMAEMVRLITQRGPKIDEIARDIGVYKETVRYWYNQLLKNGFRIQATRNHEKLGLKRVILVVSLAEEFREHADTIFTVLGNLAYFVSFSKTLPEGYYVSNASVPTECVSSWTDFVHGLKTIGVFSSIDYVSMDWVRNIPMWADHYNFQTCSWEFDWSNTRVNSQAVDVPEPAERQKYDGLDLKILEEFQVDANTTLAEIGHETGIKYKMLAWHWRLHVSGKGLVKMYQVNWTGANYDAISKKPIHRKHRYTWVDLIASEISDEVKLRLISKLNQTPFVWIEAGGVGSYYARMVFPVEDMPEALEFIEGAVSLARGKVRWFHMDQTHALYFTLPSASFDEENQLWSFNGSDLLARFEMLVQKLARPS